MNPPRLHTRRVTVRVMPDHKVSEKRTHSVQLPDLPGKTTAEEKEWKDKTEKGDSRQVT